MLSRARILMVKLDIGDDKAYNGIANKYIV